MSPDSTAPPIALGLVLVHGVGEQARGTTLLTWLDTIVGTIEAATAGRVSVEVERAALGGGSGPGGASPPHALLRLRGDGVDERWLAAEACWAQTFIAPSFDQLVSWSFRAVPWTIAMHVTQRYRRLDDVAGGARRLAARLLVAGQLLAALLVAPLVVLALALSLLVGLVPIAAVRGAVGRIQRALAATAGDSMVFLESPVTAAAVCSEVTGALGWIERTCGPDWRGPRVILAHSQGATVALEALRRAAEADAPAGAARPAVLVTFGAGINKLAMLRWFGSARRGADPARDDAGAAWLERDPIRVTCVCLLAAAAVAGWFWQLVASGRITPRQLWLVPAIWLGGSAALGLAVNAAQRAIRAWGASRPRLRTVAIALLTGLIVAAVAAGIAFAEARHVEVMPFVLMVAILVVLVGTVRRTLSPGEQDDVVRSIAVPTRVGRWLDFWASADPVPNGATRTSDAGRPVSTRIWNEASTVRDHTTYWDNRDGFVLPVVRLLAEEAGSAWLGRLPRRGPDGREAGADRSRWRTGWLRAARWLIPLPWALVALTRGPDLETLRLWAVGSGDPLGAGRWLAWVPPATWVFAFRWGAVAAAAWLSYRIALAAWLAWTRAEQDVTLRQDPPEGVSAGLRLFGLATTAVLAAAFALARAHSPGDGSWRQLDVGSTLLGLLVLVIWSQILVAVAAWLFPPPRPAAPPAPGADAPA
jgi:hypothetical protein